MRGRNRNKGHHHHSGGHHHHHNPLTRVYESNGPEVKIRGTAHHVVEKYLQLARDATASGDHVTAENHYQHAEHYSRLIATAQEQLRQQNPYYQPQQATPTADNNDGSFDDGDEDGQPAPGQQFAPQQFNQQPPNYNNHQQPSYPPREQPQPFSGQQPQQQNRPQHQPYQQQPQQPQQPHQQQPQFQPPPVNNFDSNEGLPSFITGGQTPAPTPQPQPQHQGGQNGYDNNQGDRFPRHRRRRHRGGPRPDLQQPGQQNFRSEDGPEPGNS